MANTLAVAIKRFEAWRGDVGAELRAWAQEDWRWYLISFLFHAALMLLVAITMTLSSCRLGHSSFEPGVTLEAPDDMTRPDPPAITKDFHIGQAPVEVTNLDVDALTQLSQPKQTAKYYNDATRFEEMQGGRGSESDAPQFGGAGGFSVDNLAGIGGPGGVGKSTGHADHAGPGGDGNGFGRRNQGMREAINGTGGGTRQTDRAVIGGIMWLARHQNANGSWSLQFTRRCSGGGCSAPGVIYSDVGATALAVLPFLGCGQTHKASGPYRKEVANALFWLTKRQLPNGDMATNGQSHMYVHALATIALCEAYGMTHDNALADSAQRAVRFIEVAQNPTTGGWRYEPGAIDSDTSVFGWQIMALRSAQMAGLAVNSMTIDNARKWLPMVAKGEHMGLYAYMPYREVTPSMTAVGVLCSQYLGTGHDHPAMIEGKQYLLENLPDNNSLRNIYYWYYATLAMHNLMGHDWDVWNRAMRRALVESQCHAGCAEGSWDPINPTQDLWADKGGRLMMTAMAVLTLEVYYRHLPLFRMDETTPGAPAAADTAPLATKSVRAVGFTGN